MTRSPKETSLPLELETGLGAVRVAADLPWHEPAEQEGDTLGNYELIKLVGEGSMGRVFLARHVRLGRQVAVKVMRPEHLRNRGLIERFFQEARSVNQINHEHIVEVFDFVEELESSGRVRAYCVMELLVGCSLAELMEKERLPIARGIRIARQVCRALQATHELGVVHRDVKPDNIFITQREAQPDFVKVLDFGVAKLITPLGEDKLQGTVEGTIVGTPPYMAPEQAAGLAAAFAADIYALGVVLYEMLSGRVPFASEGFGQLVVQIITESPPPLPPVSVSGERIPAELKALVMRCLQKDPAKRPSSMAELDQALGDILDGRTGRGWVKRTAVSMSAAAAVFAVALVAARLVHFSPASASPHVAQAAKPEWQVIAAPVAGPDRLVQTAIVLPQQPSFADAIVAAEVKTTPQKAAAQRPANRARKKLSRDGIINPFDG